MNTLAALPAIEGRKFGTVSLGYDRIESIRAEFSVLSAFAALLLGTTPEDLTVPQVQELGAAVEAQAGEVTEAQLERVREEHGAHVVRNLLALAVAALHPPVDT